MTQLADRDVVSRARTVRTDVDRACRGPSSGRKAWADPSLPFRYQAYGLALFSELECPAFTPLTELPPARTPVTIRTGSIASEWGTPRSTANGYTATPGRLHLWIAGVGDFLALDGSTILVDPAPDSDPAEVRAYLLGSVLGTILHQCGVMVLHGSAVQTPAGAVVFAAERGVGKSTLAAAMHRAGYPMLTDDLCAIRRGSRRELWVAPGPHRVKLDPGTAVHLGLDASAGLPLGVGRRKRAFALRDGRPSRVPLAAICELTVGEGAAPQVARLDVHGAYLTLMMHTYRRSWVSLLGVQAQLFDYAAAILAQVPVYRLIRPEVGWDTEALVQLIEEVGT